MAININIDSQIVVQAAAAWAADATVYSAQRILVTSDVVWTGTDQRKFKIADGVQTWANLDYVPFDLKQDTLVSGTNIKTVNGSSLLGSGDISVTATLNMIEIQVFM